MEWYEREISFFVPSNLERLDVKERKKGASTK
jgi:hypothetical protein